MSETPISPIDDQKSSQVMYNTDQIMSNREAQRAFFEHAEIGNLYSPAPPEFDLYEEPKAFDPSIMAETNDQSVFTEAPKYAMEPISHRESLEQAYKNMTTLELVRDARLCTKAIVMTRHLH